VRGIVLRVLITAFALWLANEFVPGLRIERTSTFFVAAALLGIINAVVRPVVVLLTFPITLLTLGLFLLVINATMLGLVAYLLEGFWIAGFLAALVGSIVVSVVSGVANWLIGPDGRLDRMERGH
jgi:putative membrane protein